FEAHGSVLLAAALQPSFEILGQRARALGLALAGWMASRRGSRGSDLLGLDGARRRALGRLFAGLQRAGDIGEEARIVAGGEPWRRVGDRLKQRVEPDCVGLGEVVQHVAEDLLLGPRMADADAHAGKLVADMRGDGAQAVVSGVATAGFYLELARREV